MTSNNILVTFGDITAMASRLRNDGGVIAGQLDSLLGAVQALVESGWQGQAAGAFHGLYANATQGWKEVEVALVGMAEMLDRIGAQYTEQESSIAASLSA